MSDRGAPQVGPDQRYWRRRANRRVRKARRTINLMRWTLILAVNGVLAAAVFYSVRKTVDYLTTTEEFAVRRIEISGTRYASPEAIRARMAERIEGNMLHLDLDGLERAVLEDPWVRGVAVRRVLPNTLYVRVVERMPSARAIIDEQVYLVDSTGYVIGPSRGGDDAGLPLLAGLETEDREILRQDLRRGVTALERLRRTSAAFVGIVSRLDLARDDRIAITLTTGEPTILLDPERVEQNLLYFIELRPEIKRRVGSADYIDLRWRDRISVMPANHTPHGRTR